MNKYQEAVSAIRLHLPSRPGLWDFVRFATLAPSSHNTQPWKFRLGDDTVDILPDFSRRTPVVDPDDHHLYVSLGCAAENLLIAASACGRPGEIMVLTDENGHALIRVMLGRGERRDIDLCAAIPSRQSTRSTYDGQPLSPDELGCLEESVNMSGVDLVIMTDRAKLGQALNYMQQGNGAQFEDPKFIRELKSWIRFNPTAALKSGDGLSGPSTGNPSAPSWLGPLIFGLTANKTSENQKLAKQIDSSAGLAIFIAEEENPEGWIKVGRAFERFALRATVLGIRHAHVNMPIEVTELRPAFADWLGVSGRRPDLIIRFGKAPAMPMSMRRALDSVLVSA